MFEDLKLRQQAGMSAREKTRLFLTVSLALALGVAIVGAHSCSEAVISVPTVANPTEARPRVARTLDPAVFEALRAAGGSAGALDAKALDAVLSEVRRKEVDLATHAPMPAGRAAALDPKAAVGTPIEVIGVVRSLDSESYESAQGGRIDRLWSFALHDAGDPEGGGRVIVVHGGSSSEPEAGKPVDAFRVQGVAVNRLADDDIVVVRGVYLQKKTDGVVGRMQVGEPTAIVVGSEYRRLPTATAAPAPKQLSDIDWAGVPDRVLKQTLRVEEPAHFQTLAWAQAKGHDAVVADIRSGAIPTLLYDRDAFKKWYSELLRDARAAEKDPDAPDQRTWTNSVKGQVFELTGQLQYFDEEGWETVAPNVFGVSRRWNVWLASDHHHAHTPIRLHSAFPLSEYAGIQPPTPGKRQHVKAYGVFLKNLSWPVAAADGGTRDMTAPYFLMIHLQPFVPYESKGLWNNVFWYTALALLVLGILFYVVLIRGERKEASTMETRRIALKKRIRATTPAPGSPSPAAPSATTPPPGSHDPFPTSTSGGDPPSDPAP